MSKPKIVQGEDRTLTIVLKDEDGACYDLTGTTAVTAEFKLTAGGCLSKTLGSGVTIVSNEGGKMTIDLDAADTLTMLVGSAVDFEVTFTQNSKVRIVQFAKAIQVVAQIC